MNSNPAQTAAQDQSDAAFADAVLITGLAIAKHSDDSTAHISQTGPFSDQVKEAFFAWMKDKPYQCKHDPLKTGRSMAHWPMWNRHFHCSDCFEANHQAIAGTDEDRRCDFCGVVQPPGPVCLTTSCLLLQIKPTDGLVLPPIALHYGVCRRCRDGQ